MKKVMVILSALAVLGTLGGFGVALDKHYAKASEHQMLCSQVNYLILKLRAESVQERMWALEDRYGTIDKMPEPVRREYRKLQAELQLLLIKLKKND